MYLTDEHKAELDKKGHLFFNRNELSETTLDILLVEGFSISIDKLKADEFRCLIRDPDYDAIDDSYGETADIAIEKAMASLVIKTFNEKSAEIKRLEALADKLRGY